MDAMGNSSYRDEHELKARGVVIGPWGNLAFTNITLLQLQLQLLLLLLLGQEGSHLPGQGLWCLLLIIGWHDPPLLSHTASQSLLCWLLALRSAVSISANQPVQSNSLTALTNLISYLRGALCHTTPITTVVYSGLRTFGGGENWVINLCRRLRDSPRSICSSASPNTLVGPPYPRPKTPSQVPQTLTKQSLTCEQHPPCIMGSCLVVASWWYSMRKLSCLEIFKKRKLEWSCPIINFEILNVNVMLI